MSPSTLDHRLKFLISVKAVERIGLNRKNVVYRFVQLKPVEWYLEGVNRALAESLNILDLHSGVDVSRLSNDQLGKLCGKLIEASELISSYAESRTREQ